MIASTKMICGPFGGYFEKAVVSLLGEIAFSDPDALDIDTTRDCPVVLENLQEITEADSVCVLIQYRSRHDWVDQHYFDGSFEDLLQKVSEF